MKNRGIIGIFCLLVSILFLQGATFGKTIAPKWDNATSYVASQRVKATIDTKVKPKGCAYSIKIVNDKVGCSNVSKTFRVKKNTHYRACVKAKYVGYVESKKFKTKSGASLGKVNSYSGSKRHQKNVWTELSYEFDTKNETTYTLALWNGMFCADCKGTAYYADFKLEECKETKTNEWNVMLVFFNRVKASVKMDGKKYLQNKQYTKSDITYMADIMKHTYVSLPLLSDDKWKIKSIDVYQSNKTITASDLSTYGENGYCLNYSSNNIDDELDRMISHAEKQSGKVYNQIVIICPLNGINGGWLGLGGSTYNGINICQLLHEPGKEDYTQVGKNYFESAIVHEMLHGINRISNEVNPKKTVLLHENIGIYEKDYTMHDQNGWDNWGAWHSDYMRSETPNKKGIDAKAYLVYNKNQYKTIYGNQKKTSYKKTDVTALKIANVKAQMYAGTEVRPTVVVKNGKYKLKEGKDYKLSYIENKGVGKACVVITGKGKYTGSVCKVFTVNPKSPVLAGNIVDGKYHFSWTKSADAQYYQLLCSTNGGKTYTIVKTVDASLVETEVVLPAGKNYRFKIQACKKMYPKKFCSAYSNEITF